MPIINFQREFLVVARKIRDELRAIRESTEQQSRRTSEELQAAKEKPDPTPEIRSILNTLQRIEDRQGTANESQGRHQRRNLIAQWSGVLAIVAYTSVAAWQGCTMSRTLKEIQKQTPKLAESADAARYGSRTAASALAENEKQFKIDERPYLTKDYVRLAEKPVKGRKLAGEVFWRNTGRTPAIHVHSWLRIDVLNHEPRNPAQWAAYAKAQKPQIDFGSGVGRSVSVEGNNPLEEPWFGEITSKTSHIYIYGAVVYQDVFGDQHESSVCAMYEPGSINELFLWGCKGSHTDDVK